MSLLYVTTAFVFLSLLHTMHSYKVYGKKNLPKKGPYIVASNHVSNADPIVVGCLTPFGHIYFFAKDELFHHKKWGWWFRGMKAISTNRDRRDYKAVKKALQYLKNGKCIGVFPEGTRSTNGELGQEGGLGIGLLVEKTGAPVIPIYLVGTNKALPPGSKYKTGTPVRTYIGKRVDFSGAQRIKDRRKRYEFFTKRVMKAISEVKRRALRNERMLSKGRL